MNEDPAASDKSDHATNPQQDMGLMLQKRAQYRLERASEKRYRSPAYIAIRTLFVAIVIGLFLLLIDKGIKVTHKIIDIWTPVLFDAKKPPLPKPKSATNADKPFMVKVEPGSQSSSRSASSSQ
ncbi:MAG: hypothetical protein ABUS47_14310 [Steroidobacter sp.]